MSYITGGDACRVTDWIDNKGPPRVELGLIPTVVMTGETPRVDVPATWALATLILERPEALPGTRISPPTQIIKLMDKPEFRLLQFNPNGTPCLAYKRFSTPGPMISSHVTLVRVATVDQLKNVSTNKRMVYPLQQPGVKRPDSASSASPTPLPDPVAVLATRHMTNYGAGPSNTRANSSRNSSATSTGSDSATPPKINLHPVSVRLKRTPLRTNVLQSSPGARMSSASSKSYTVGVIPKKKRASVTLTFQEDSDEDNVPHNETIDLATDTTDTSQEDPDQPHDDRGEPSKPKEPPVKKPRQEEGDKEDEGGPHNN